MALRAYGLGRGNVHTLGQLLAVRMGNARIKKQVEDKEMARIAWSKDHSKNQERLDKMVFKPYVPGSGARRSTIDRTYMFQIVQNNGEGATIWTGCRDYIHDIYRMAFTGETELYYGPNYSPRYHKKRPLPTNLIMLAVKGLDDKGAALAIRLLHHYEEMLGFDKSVYAKKVNGTSTYHLFMGSKQWLAGGGFISLYSFWIRFAQFHGYPGFSDFKTDDELQAVFKAILGDNNMRFKTDVGYLRSIAPNINHVLSFGSSLFKGEWKVAYEDRHAEWGGSWHGGAGIVSLCSGYYINEHANQLTKIKKS